MNLFFRKELHKAPHLDWAIFADHCINPRCTIPMQLSSIYKFTSNDRKICPSITFKADRGSWFLIPINK